MDPERLAAASAIFDRHYGPADGQEPPVEEAAAAEQATPVESSVEQTPAPEPTTEEAAAAVDPAEDLGASFKLDDVPEEYREHVKRYVDMTHGAFTRKTQSLAEQRREAEAAIALHQRLNDPETRDEALRELLTTSGWSVMDDGDGAEAATPGEAGTEPPADSPTTDPELRARIEKIEQQQAAQTQREADAQREEYLEAVKDVIDEGLEDLARTEFGIEDGDVGKLPAHVRDLVLGFARQLPAIDGRWPDMSGAVARYRELRAAEIQGYVASKRAPTVDLSGSTGTPKFDGRDRKARLAAANAVAGRHLT